MKIKNKKNGFTMLEAVIATSIVTIGIISLLIASQDAVLSVYFIRDRFTAAYLAKEGVEIVKNIRDQNWLRRQTWNAGLAPGTYEVQHNSMALEVAHVPLRFLRIDPATGFYNYATGALTKFQREIILTNISADHIRVQVNVRWRNGRDHNLLVEESLYNWR